MKSSRRDFLIGSLALTLGGCATSKNAGLKSDDSSPRTPSGQSDLGFRLSTPNNELKSHYTAVVIGSGYGASVMAARLSSKYKDLCILERGKEWHPGDFPEKPEDLPNALKSTLNPLGLIDIATGQDLEIICGNGLGGTSLINAAIAVRPELNVFEQSVWPEEIAQDAKSGRLEKFYQIAESILQPTTLNQIRFEKSKLHQLNAKALGRQWDELSLNIRNDSYGTTKANDFGYPQSQCQSCGNCCTGCNYGAKNTLLTNYLFLAYKQGAKIFTQVEVEKISKKNSQYVLHIKLVPSVGPSKRKTITADVVFLGAGSKGSTQILMRSQSEDFKFSEALGTRLSANGDVMGMSYNTDHKTNVIASTKEKLRQGPGQQGLIISSYANYRNPSLNNDVMSQFLLLDGVFPSSLADTVAKVFAAHTLAKQNYLFKSLTGAAKSEKIERIKRDILKADPDGALNHSMLYFACGHDSSGGKFVYNRTFDKFDYRWKNVTKEPTFQRIEGVMKQYAEQNGGTYISNPRTTLFGGKIQATHPLGGCPMGSSSSTGVVNHLGQVFNSRGGTHDNLYVVDASVIPHSLSATPLLTITALAERMAEAILKG